MALFCKALTTIALLALVVSNVAVARSPRKVMTIAQTCKLQSAAPEVLALRFAAIDPGTPITSKIPGAAWLPETRIYRAEVLSVQRSATGLRAGQVVMISDFAGPRDSPAGNLLSGTAVEAVFLAPINNGNFRFAALDRSFKPIAATLCRDGKPAPTEIAGKSTGIGQQSRRD